MGAFVTETSIYSTRSFCRSPGVLYVNLLCSAPPRPSPTRPVPNPFKIQPRPGDVFRCHEQVDEGQLRRAAAPSFYRAGVGRIGGGLAVPRSPSVNSAQNASKATAGAGIGPTPRPLPPWIPSIETANGAKCGQMPAASRFRTAKKFGRALHWPPDPRSHNIWKPARTEH